MLFLLTAEFVLHTIVKGERVLQRNCRNNRLHVVLFIKSSVNHAWHHNAGWCSYFCFWTRRLLLLWDAYASCSFTNTYTVNAMFVASYSYCIISDHDKQEDACSSKTPNGLRCSWGHFQLKSNPFTFSFCGDMFPWYLGIKIFTDI